MAVPWEALETLLNTYEGWLEIQPLAQNTRLAYRRQVRYFLRFVADEFLDVYGDPLADANARLYAVRDYRTHLLKVRRLGPSSLNQTLAAVDHFFRFLGGGRPEVARAQTTQQAPRALEEEEMRRFLRAVERCSSARDRPRAGGLRGLSHVEESAGGRRDTLGSEPYRSERNGTPEQAFLARNEEQRRRGIAAGGRGTPWKSQQLSAMRKRRPTLPPRPPPREPHEDYYEPCVRRI